MRGGAPRVMQLENCPARRLSLLVIFMPEVPSVCPPTSATPTTARAITPTPNHRSRSGSSLAKGTRAPSEAKHCDGVPCLSPQLGKEPLVWRSTVQCQCPLGRDPRSAGSPDYCVSVEPSVHQFFTVSGAYGLAVVNVHTLEMSLVAMSFSVADAIG